MLTLNMTPEEDRELILIVRINLDTEYMYFSDAENQITLSGIAFDGKVISKNSISEATKDIDVTQGGTIGQVGNWNLSLARYTSYTNGTTTFDDFFNDFAPATSKPLLTSKTVDVGFCWGSAVDITEITWAYQFYIETYDWTTYALNLGCIEYDELVAKQLPYYTIQKEKDNGISYFANAPEESYGQAIPIVYGDFAYTALEYEQYRLAPMVQTSKGGFQFKASSHICKEVEPASYLFEYLDSVKTVMRLSSASGSNVNARSGHSISIATARKPVLGKLYIILRSWTDGGTNIDQALDDDINTYGTLAVNTTAKLKLGSGLSEEQLGQLDGTLAQCKMKMIWESASASAGFMWIFHPDFVDNAFAGYHAIYQPLSGSGIQTSTYSFGVGNYDYATVPAKWNDTAAWTAKELDFIEFHILNSLASDQMKIYHCYLEFTDVVKYTRNATGISQRVRNNGGRNVDNKLIPRSMWPNPETELINESSIFGYLKGYMYDYWID